MTDPSPDCGYTEEEQERVEFWTERPSVSLTRFGSYKLMEIRPFRPRSWRETIVIAWGVDIFVWQIPLLKLFIALTLAFNALFWWLLS